MTRIEFANALLSRLRAPTTRRNRQAMIAWMQTEGYGGKNNPLNTTMPMPGSTIFNTHGVRNYVSIDDGVEAAREDAAPIRRPLRLREGDRPLPQLAPARANAASPDRLVVGNYRSCPPSLGGRKADLARHGFGASGKLGRTP